MPDNLNTLKAALGNATSTYTFKGKVYQLEEWDLNDVADIEELIGDVGRLNVSKASHQRLALWIAMRRADDMLTPPERRACQWRMTLADVGSIVKAADLRKVETFAFVAAILKASGLVEQESSEKKESAEELEAVAEPTGETLSPS